MATFLLFFLSLLTLASPLPSQEILDAAEILSNSGFVSMALTLELVYPQTRIPQSPTVTIFAPPDSAFVKSGQPSLSLLQLHISPIAFSYESLKSLPFDTKIPTMSPGLSLVVTTFGSDHEISINGVKINGSPIFDDGSLIIYGIEDFFDPNYQVSAPGQSSDPNHGCIVSITDEMGTSPIDYYSFDEASGLLRSNGYSVMASFLDLQLKGFKDETKMTVFAPVDEVMAFYVGNFTQYLSIFLRHVVPCKLSWSDLVNFDVGIVLRTYLDGFTINITRSGDVLMFNGAQIIVSDIYKNDWLAVHGLGDIFDSPAERPESEDLTDYPSDRRGRKSEGIVRDRVEF